MTTPSPYPGYYQASDGQWYPVPAAAPAAPPPPPPGPPAGYGQPPQAAPAPVLARGTLDDFLDQPSGGSAATSKFFTPARMQGHWIRVRVTRDLNHSDVRQQTDKFQKPLTFAYSGKPKWQLLIPCQILESSDPAAAQQAFTDGGVTVYLKGVVSDSFKQAMAAAGVSDPTAALQKGKLAGAEFYMISAGTKSFGQGNPANMFDFNYTATGRELQDDGPGVAVTPGPEAAIPPTAQPAAAPIASPPAAPIQPPAIPQVAAPVAPPVAQTAVPAPVSAVPTAAGYAPQQAAVPPPPVPGGFNPPPAPPVGQQPVPPPGVTPPPAPVPPGYAAPAAAPVPDNKAALLARLSGQQQ